jgi:peptidoglycan-associated lipoprotein
MHARFSPESSLALAAALLAAGLVGCAGGGAGSGAGSTMDDGGAAETVDDDEFGARGPVDARERPDAGVEESARLAEAARNLEPVFFAFDESDLTAEARATLAANARWLRDNPDVDAWIEGHCDERGTNEYNLALGERRARAARDYLVQSGVSSTRLRTISYGEERPFALGHDESAWRLNRRAQFRPQLR